MDVELWLIRHGETEYTCRGQVSGWHDVSLTPRGEEQARALKGVLSEKYFDSVWASDLERAITTAHLAWGCAQTDWRLRELDFGAIEGRVWDTLEAEWRDALLAWEGFHAPFGESTRQFQVRVFEFLATLPPGKHLLFVHAGLLRLVLREVGADQFLPPTSLVVLNWTRRELVQLRPPEALPEV